jgi:RNA polymerase-interacting CarD/CdnL/TRCF family regulator
LTAPLDFKAKIGYSELREVDVTWVSELKVGDAIVDAGSVCEIFKIEKSLIYFRPYFQVGYSPIVCSIPAENLGKTKIRRIVTHKGLGKIMQVLAGSLDADFEVDTEFAKEVINSNKPKRMAKVISKLWGEQQDEEIGLSKSKRAALELMVDTLAEEVAYLYDCGLEEGKKKITRRLKRSLR